MTRKEKIDFIMSVVKEERGHISLTKAFCYKGNYLMVTCIQNGTIWYWCWYNRENSYGKTTLSIVENNIIDGVVDCIKNNYYI